MRAIDLPEVERRLALVESENDPQRAEYLLFDVIRPLLEAEGYTVEHTGGPGDQGIDFLATRSSLSRGLPPRVGVQYKHGRRPVGGATVHQVIGASAINNLQRVLLVSKSGFSDSARTLLERALPTDLELLDLPFLRAWFARLVGASEPTSPSAIQAINDLSAQLARIIARTPVELDNIEWRDLERMIAVIFAKLGFETTLTPSAKDGGKDVIVRFSAAGQDRSFIIEAKHWRSGQKVGAAYVTDFLRVIAREERDGGLFLATAGYTGCAFDSVTTIERRRFHAGDEKKVTALCRTFVRAEASLFTAPADLTAVITNDTLIV